MASDNGISLYGAVIYTILNSGEFTDRRVILLLIGKTSCGGGTFRGHVLIGASLKSALCPVRPRGKEECSYMTK